MRKSYDKSRKTLLCLFFSFCLLGQYSLFAQILVRGQVTSSDDGDPLPGVNILAKGTTIGTITNLEGDYSFNFPSDADVLVFSFIGFQKQEVKINGQTVINVVLSPDMQSLNEVVVVGYGEQSRSRLTTSVSKLDTKVLENVPFANLGSALQGTIAGLRVTTTTGMPGASPRIIIRGGTSINNPNGANPLYIIDGVIRDNMEDIN